MEDNKTMNEFEQEVLSNPNLMTPQEAGRATYKAETPDKNGMTLFLNKERLTQVTREGFAEMQQEEK